MDRSLELQRAMEGVQAINDEKAQKRVHLRSVHNFIIYFDDLQNEHDKEWVYESLKAYFDEVGALGSTLADVSPNEGKRMYDEHIEKVAQLYQSQLGFTMIAGRFLMFIFFIFLYFMVLIFGGFYWSLLVPVIYVGAAYSNNRKRWSRRVYGVYY